MYVFNVCYLRDENDLIVYDELFFFYEFVYLLFLGLWFVFCIDKCFLFLYKIVLEVYVVFFVFIFFLGSCLIKFINVVNFLGGGIWFFIVLFL